MPNEQLLRFFGGLTDLQAIQAALEGMEDPEPGGGGGADTAEAPQTATAPETAVAQSNLAVINEEDAPDSVDARMVELWELQVCKCPAGTPPMKSIWPGEFHLRCFGCGAPYRGTDSQLQTVVIKEEMKEAMKEEMK